jgi:hypothetical protein
MKSVAKPAGYSGTPLAKKLGIREGARVAALGAPEGYTALLAPLPAGVAFESRVGQRTDVIHVFVKSRAEMAKALAAARPKMRDDASLWISWPKKASKVPTDVTEDTVRELAFPLGLVDVKVCAVDETWSGLKLVVRLANRK